MSNSDNSVLQGSHLAKSFQDGKLDVTVLNDVNITVAKGEMVAIIGASGSGKSTLLHVLGGLDRPDEGEVLLNGQAFSTLSDKAQCYMRNQHLGFVYQFHHLLPEFTALENVAMPALIKGESVSQAMADATALLAQVGLSHRLGHKVGELSGGERQRAAVARALINKPSCVLADEPTGNLDPTTAKNVFDMIVDLQKSLGMSFILVTHDPHIASSADRQLVLQNGRLV